MGAQALPVETVPDSEEERECIRAKDRNAFKASMMEIIEISSSDEEWNASPSTGRPHDTSYQASTKVTTVSNTNSLHLAEIIELTDSSDSSSELPSQLSKLIRKSGKETPRKTAPSRTFAPLYADDDDVSSCEGDNGAILTLDEPRSARKPIRRKPKPISSIHDISSTNTSTSNLILEKVDSSSEENAFNDGNPFSLNRRNVISSSLKSPTKPPRITKKSQLAAGQARRAKYASDLFIELNRTVFNNGLPSETKLNWSKRLLTTAGRAKWHRSREGIDTTEIELATKILDCDERIRNTLSHEMCHLACWIINKDPKEGHGRIFKAWATRVSRKRPEIEISTRHNYEISYPYEWKCQQCSKIYGRYSKSIRPDECVCGACKVGKLVALFTERAPRTPRTAKVSRMATATPQSALPTTRGPLKCAE
ncbi:SprT-like family-domain-containing protein [Hygrophoropsis aurantiaca]|uniref:SprT-like family-domain-containing protein n=1 Tax=Hygrophoropsis aurantiaca TaxID=72124 RepID=A0ACB8ALY6_9AGAM|nr:SprT-like family-domain-containing protein [Hygrophoropsis aurantiaca]